MRKTPKPTKYNGPIYVVNRTRSPLTIARLVTDDGTLYRKLTVGSIYDHGRIGYPPAALKIEPQEMDEIRTKARYRGAQKTILWMRGHRDFEILTAEQYHQAYPNGLAAEAVRQTVDLGFGVTDPALREAVTGGR